MFSISLFPQGDVEKLFEIFEMNLGGCDIGLDETSFLKTFIFLSKALFTTYQKLNLTPNVNIDTQDSNGNKTCEVKSPPNSNEAA